MKKKISRTYVVIALVILLSIAGMVSAQGLPDLVGKIKCPPEAKAGQDLGNTIRVWLMNRGDANAKEVGIDIVLSSDAIIPMTMAVYKPNWNEDVLLLGGREFEMFVPARRPFKRVVLNGNNKIPADTPSGIYYLGVFVDSKNVNRESNERNNTKVCRIKISNPQQTGGDIPQTGLPGETPGGQRLPDLVALKAYAKPAKVKEGTKVNLHCDFKNRKADLHGSWTISYQVDGQEVYSQKWGDIPRNGFRNPSGWWIAKGIGWHKYTCVLDSGNDIAERNETNNRAHGRFEVINGGTTPTLEIATHQLPTLELASGPDLKAEKVYVTPDPADSGKQVKLHCHFRNAGTNLVGKWTLSYQIDGAEVYAQSWGDILAGKFRNPNGIWTATTLGYHSFRCVLDSGNAITETNEANNSLTMRFEVIGGDDIPQTGLPGTTPDVGDNGKPDLVVARMACPPTARQGEDLGEKIRVYIQNIGAADATGIGVDLILSKNPHIPAKTAIVSMNFKEDGLLVGGREFITSLSAGAGQNVKMNGSNTIPSDTKPGYYYIGVFVDSTFNNAEEDESNNTGKCRIKIIPANIARTIVM